MDMEEILWTIFSWIVKGLCLLAIISIIAFICYFFWAIVTNGGRKWYYYDSSKPWKGGYWTPLLPRTPPYNEYKWNPETCRFEHKETGEPLFSWQEPVMRSDVSHKKPSARKKQRPEWLRFMLEETPASLMEKRRRRKWAEQREEEMRRRTTSK